RSPSRRRARARTPPPPRPSAPRRRARWRGRRWCSESPRAGGADNARERDHEERRGGERPPEPPLALERPHDGVGTLERPPHVGAVGARGREARLLAGREERLEVPRDLEGEARAPESLRGGRGRDGAGRQVELGG